MLDGYIKIHRALESWRWGDDPVMVYFWVRILMMANWEDSNWRDKVIKRGSFTTTVLSLSSTLRLSVKQIRTCLGRLRAGGEVTTDTSNNYTLITICNYDSYQCAEANEGQMKGKQKTSLPRSPSSPPPTPPTTTPPISPSLFEEESKEGDTVVSSKKETIDYDFIKNMWNDSMTRKVPKIVSVSDARKEKIRLRVAEMGGWIEAQKFIMDCFRKINESDYCNGENDNKWVSTFDWFFANDKNWLKVLEGNYDNRKRKTSIDILKENIEKADAYYAQRYGYGGASAYGVPAGGRSDDPDEQ